MKINNINIEVERKNIKNVHLSVYPPDGRVHVSAPLACGGPSRDAVADMVAECCFVR